MTQYVFCCRAAGNGKKSGTPAAFNQQQNGGGQAFIFSSELANRASDQVVTGAHKSIYSVHTDDHSTKQFTQVTAALVQAGKSAALVQAGKSAALVLAGKSTVLVFAGKQDICSC